MLTGALGCCLAHETLLSQAGTDTSSPDFTMDMTEMNHPGSESETELSIKLEDPEEQPYQEQGGRWRGPEGVCISIFSELPYC